MQRRIALVTGASGGIGRAIALQLAQDGHTVVLNYWRNRPAVEALHHLITERQGRSLIKQFNVACSAEVNTAIADITAAYGPIEILVNNAGGAHMGGAPAAWNHLTQIRKMSDTVWDAILATNLTGTYFCTRAVLQALGRRKGFGRIVNITSLAGEVGQAFLGHYSAAKAGMVGLTKALARELAPQEITVNAVAPGLIQTDATAGAFMARVLPDIPLRRPGLPEEVAHLVSFLVSDKAAYITGQVICIDGGWHMT